MSANQSPLNQFAGGRVVPDALQNLETPALAVPQDVPWVAPVNIIPPNLRQSQELSTLNRLAKQLGSQEFTGGLVEGIAKAREKKKAVEDAKQYNLGIEDATKRASVSRDVFGSLMTNGLMPLSQNPSYLLGLQVQTANFLTSQYREDLVTARLNNPEMSPTELQANVRQKYQGTFKQFDSRVIGEYFLKPVKDIEADDLRLWQDGVSKSMEAKRINAVGGTLHNIISSEKKLGSTPEVIQEKVSKQILQNLQVETATLGYATQPTIDAQVDAVIAQAGMEETLGGKLAILDSLLAVKFPDGSDFVSNHGVGTKYTKARTDLIRGQYEIDHLKNQAASMEFDANTQKVEEAIALSRLGGKEMTLDAALTMGKSLGHFDPNKVETAWKRSTSLTLELPAREEQNQVKVWTDRTEGQDPSVANLTMMKQNVPPEVRRQVVENAKLTQQAQGRGLPKDVAEYAESRLDAAITAATAGVNIESIIGGAVPKVAGKFDKVVEEVNKAEAAHWKPLVSRVAQEAIQKGEDPNEAVNAYLNKIAPVVQQHVKALNNPADPRTLGEILRETDKTQMGNPKKAVPQKPAPRTAIPGKDAWITGKDTNAEVDFMAHRGPIWTFAVNVGIRMGKSKAEAERWADKQTPNSLRGLIQQGQQRQKAKQPSGGDQ